MLCHLALAHSKIRRNTTERVPLSDPVFGKELHEKRTHFLLSEKCIKTYSGLSKLTLKLPKVHYHIFTTCRPVLCPTHRPT
jgi:hypothetical protein